MWKKQKNSLQNQIPMLISGVLIGILGSLTGSMVAYGGWIQPEEGRWAYQFEDGYSAVGWFLDADGKWYRMGEDGLMLAHQWYQDTDGSWYRMGESGSMLVEQWYQDIDGKWYYLSQSGTMLVSSVTPDGYTVDAGGVWDGGAAVQMSGGSSGRRSGGSSSGGGGGGHGGGSQNSDGNDSSLSGSLSSGSNYGEENDNGSIGDESNGSAENGNGIVEDDDGGDIWGGNQDGILNAEQSLLAWYELAKQAESEITEEALEHIENSRFLATDQTGINLRLATIAGQIMDSQEEDFWEVYVIGKNIVPNGTILKAIFRDNIQYSHLKLDMIVVENDVYHISKFVIVRTSDEIPEEKETTEGYWKIGDWVTHEIDGESYTFRCIDEDYMDLQNPEKKAALFLCDSVIPADWKSVYVPQQKEDGVFEYEFIAGPIVNFGRNNDYKYSAIRSWLNENDDDFQDAMKINTGVSYAYRGSTEEGMFEAFDAENLTPVYIGKQNMRDSLFVLSVDEALTYRDYLWCFDGESEENSDSQINMFCKGYWLRTPAQVQALDENEQVYIVDLVNGNLRSMSIMPENMEETEDEELMVTTGIGVRPAFVMEQKYLMEYGEDKM